MTEPTRTPVAGDERVAELQQQVEELRSALDGLRASLAGEVRTRRLVVEEEDGFERIVAKGGPFFGAVTVHARPADGAHADVALVGSDEYLAPVAKVYVTATTGTGTFGVLEASGPMGGEDSRCELRLDPPQGGHGVIADSASPTLRQLAGEVAALTARCQDFATILAGAGAVFATVRPDRDEAQPA